jgi:hypothetical protein
VKLKAILLCSAMALLLAANPSTRPTPIQGDSIGADVVVLGQLGVPVGQEVTIGGHKKAVGPFPDMFSVDTIDGKNAPAGIRLEVAGVGAWPDGTAATLKGCEVGTLRYLQLSETNFGPDDDRWKGPHQQLFLKFEASEVVKPANLKLSPPE